MIYLNSSSILISYANAENLLTELLCIISYTCAMSGVFLNLEYISGHVFWKFQRKGDKPMITG